MIILQEFLSFDVDLNLLEFLVELLGLRGEVVVETKVCEDGANVVFIFLLEGIELIVFCHFFLKYDY
jgi:hypothetical protein